MKIAIVTQHANPLHPRAGASPRPDDAGLSELARLLARQGSQGDRVRAEAQPDSPDSAAACASCTPSAGPAGSRPDGYRDLGIPIVQAFSSLGVAEQRDHASADPATPPPARLRGGAGHWPTPTVFAGAVTKTARLLANKGPQSTYVRNS
jgi:hypothetical protein